jgi:KilA-N domain
MNSLTIGTSSIRTIDGLYSLNDLHKAAGNEAKHQPALFVRSDQTKALIQEIKRSTDSHIALKTKRGGDLQGTYACKELVYAYAMWISAAFMLQVIRAYDSLVSVQPALPNTINPEQIGIIYQIVCEQNPVGVDRHAAWGRFGRHFNINSYKLLPASRFDEALQYLGGKVQPVAHQPVLGVGQLIIERNRLADMMRDVKILAACIESNMSKLYTRMDYLSVMPSDLTDDNWRRHAIAC